MPDEASEYKITLKDVHRELVGKFDALTISVQALATANTRDVTDLKVRVGHLEDAAARRWNAWGPWLGAATAIVVAFIPIIIHH